MGQGEDGDGATGERAQQTTDLWESPRLEPEDDGDDDEQDRDEVQRVHRSIVAQGSGACREGRRRVDPSRWGYVSADLSRA
jgi:hypothetical protein